MSEKKIDFKIEKVDKIPETKVNKGIIPKIKKPKINKVIIPKIEYVSKIHGYRYNKNEKKWQKVDEDEYRYLENLKNQQPLKADYIQEIYKRLKKEKMGNDKE